MNLKTLFSSFFVLAVSTLGALAVGRSIPEFPHYGADQLPYAPTYTVKQVAEYLLTRWAMGEYYVLFDNKAIEGDARPVQIEFLRVAPSSNAHAEGFRTNLLAYWPHDDSVKGYFFEDFPPSAVELQASIEELLADIGHAGFGHAINLEIER